MNLSQVIEKHGLVLSKLIGDLDFRIVPTYSGIAVYFSAIRFVDKNLYRLNEHLKASLRVGPWGYCSNDTKFSNKLLEQIHSLKNQKRNLSTDEALEILKYMSALEDLVKNCAGIELIHAITEKKFIFPINIKIDTYFL